jgi:hypothetical protein
LPDEGHFPIGSVLVKTGLAHRVPPSTPGTVPEELPDDDEPPDEDPLPDDDELPDEPPEEEDPPEEEEEEPPSGDDEEPLEDVPHPCVHARSKTPTGSRCRMAGVLEV